jgi:hypothetical protein
MGLIYNYITTNLINNNQYIGMHCTDDIDDNYLGSGKYLKEAIKKYGKENFKREIICYCETIEEAHNNEEKYIIEYNTLKPNGYNLSPKGGINGKGSLSEETKLKISNKLIGKTITEEHKNILRKCSKERIWTDEQRENQRKRMLGNNPSEETRKKLSEIRKGRKRSKETIEKIRNSNIGKKRSEETCINIGNSKRGIKQQPRSIEFKEKLRIANIGKKHSNETKEKLSNIHKKLYENGFVHPMLGKHHSEESNQRNREKHIGKILSEEQKQKISEGLKRHYLNKNKKEKV